jgi:hypothetical protein
MSPIDAAIKEIKSLVLGEKFSYRKMAEKYGVERTTLSRRHQAKNQPRSVKNLQQRAVTPAPEQELILHINKQREAGIPPLQHIVQGWASTLAGKEVSLRWVSRFLHRHQDQLVLRSTTGIDRSRHKADSEVKYDMYFKFWHSKMAEYGIKPDQICNMDEKGLLMGSTSRTHRVFSRAMWDRGELQAALQDGSREWITILATICADGTALAPSLVYSSDASAVSLSWVRDINHQDVFVTGTKSGWSNNELGVAWLRDVFDRQTRSKAMHQWRLLVTDGHASHCSIEFIEYCHQHRILLAIFPPHATHTLQPLDVVMFKPFSTAYTQELINYQQNSQGLMSMAKSDFFPLFWQAWVSSFTESLILKAFAATGLSPPNPTPPSSRSDGLAYTATLIKDPEAFEAFTQLTQYYTKVCPR